MIISLFLGQLKTPPQTHLALDHNGTRPRKSTRGVTKLISHRVNRSRPPKQLDFRQRLVPT